MHTDKKKHELAINRTETESGVWDRDGRRTNILGIDV